MIPGYSYTADSMREALRKGVVHFFFEKADGSRREAYGTLNEDVINDNYIPEPSKTGRSRSSYNYNRDDDSVVQYYDLYAGSAERGGWRSFNIDRLEEVDDTYDAF